jgi:Tfp pilus assembly protein PilV
LATQLLQTSCIVVFHKRHIAARHFAPGGFTLVEAVVAVALIGVGVASTIGALTKFNSIASISRNGTGASALLQNQVDLFQSMSPFNPQKGQIPKDLAYAGLPTYDMSAGAGAAGVPVTHIIYYKDPTTAVTVQPSNEWPVYREPARWTYADAAARTGATGFVASDVGQLAYQKDTKIYYRLQTTAPTWTQDNTNGLIVKGAMTCTVTDISITTTPPSIPSMPNTYKAVFTVTYTYLNRTYSSSMAAIRASDI